MANINFVSPFENFRQVVTAHLGAPSQQQQPITAVVALRLQEDEAAILLHYVSTSSLEASGVRIESDSYRIYDAFGVSFDYPSHNVRSAVTYPLTTGLASRLELEEYDVYLQQRTDED